MLESVIEELPLGLAVCERGTVTLANRALERLTGEPRTV